MPTDSLALLALQWPTPVLTGNFCSGAKGWWRKVRGMQCKEDIVVVRAQRDSVVEELKATEEKFSAATTKFDEALAAKDAELELEREQHYKTLQSFVAMGMLYNQAFESIPCNRHYCSAYNVDYLRYTVHSKQHAATASVMTLTLMFCTTTTMLLCTTLPQVEQNLVQESTELSQCMAQVTDKFNYMNFVKCSTFFKYSTATPPAQKLTTRLRRHLFT
eukprot:15103-Heterococcus_DN1.PRE.2